jgi:tetratricopeptide (TPR) repeat protein
MKKTLLLLAITAFAACTTKKEPATAPKPVLTSPAGLAYFKPEWSAAAKAKLDSNLRVAQAAFAQSATEENYIWLGRRLAYLYEYDSAINTFSRGLSRYPQSFRLYRHRGHRYISLRKFDDAIADLEKAATLMEGAPLETEPDGQPNKLNQPLSNTQFNVWYHLGLAYYLKGDFTKAETAYRECMEVSNNDDLVIATTDWLYMTLRRQNKVDEATALLTRITDSMTIIENDSYYKRLLMYRGRLKPEEVLNPDPAAEDYALSLATQGYGVGNWYLYNNDTARAREIFSRITADKNFAAFGFIAAEAELLRQH